jgi:HB1, ASXL, restriction endonuclease HTH domain
VLRTARQPLSPREILRRAYAGGSAPARLYGKTQHKTLQARLSEDILTMRERSAFFRTAPGRFFLREFLADQTIPEQFRQPIVARRRKRQLPYRNALAFDWEQITPIISASKNFVPREDMLKLLAQHSYHYAHSRWMPQPGKAERARSTRRRGCLERDRCC